MTRREWLASLTAATALQGQGTAKVKIGVTDWNLRKGANVGSVALAASIGFDGVEVSFGGRVVDGRLPLDRPETIAAYQEAFRKHGIGVAGTCLDVLHVNCLMNDPLAQKWVADGIRMSQQLGAKVMLLPFFGKCEMKTKADMDGPQRPGERGRKGGVDARIGEHDFGREHRPNRGKDRQSGGQSLFRCRQRVQLGARSL